jgi:hypothetical protein
MAAIRCRSKDAPISLGLQTEKGGDNDTDAQRSNQEPNALAKETVCPHYRGHPFESFARCLRLF